MNHVEAMKQALEFIDSVKVHSSLIAARDSLHDTLRDAIAEAEKQEPVAYLCENAVGHKYFRWKKPSSTYKPIALYTTPPAAQRQPLPAHEIVTMYEECPTSDSDMIAFARAVEAAHGITGEKNHSSIVSGS